MRAARVHELGASPLLGDVGDPQPAEGRSVVRIRAAALNPLDLAVAAGRFYGGHPPLPYIPGSEAVVELDDGTRGWFYGDGAGTTRDGTLAERTLVRDELVIRYPTAPTTQRPPRSESPDAPAGARLSGAASVRATVFSCSARPAPQGRSRCRERACSEPTGSLPQAATAGGWNVPSSSAPTTPCSSMQTTSSSASRNPQATTGRLWFSTSCGTGRSSPASEASAPHARLVNIGQSAGPEAALTSAAVRGKELDVLGYSLFARTPAELSALYLGLLSRAQAGDIRVDIETFPLAEVDEAWRRQAAGAKSVVVL